MGPAADTSPSWSIPGGKDRALYQQFGQMVALRNQLAYRGLHGAPTSHRGGTLTLVSAFDTGSLDPAIGMPLSIASLVGDGLVGFKRVGGVDGSTIVPDLATSIPRPTDDGRTYTFQLRPGIRYSDGRPVLASDFRRAIERDFKVGSAAASEFVHLRGADACASAPASCDLSRGILTDDGQGTITFHLTAPDPDLLYYLAVPEGFPIPPGVPDTDVGTKPVPATGPYMITNHVPNHLLELGRNPYFKQWTGNRPDGFVDRILVRLGVASEDLANEVLKGRADYVVNPTPHPAGPDEPAAHGVHPAGPHLYAGARGSSSSTRGCRRSTTSACGGP